MAETVSSTSPITSLDTVLQLSEPLGMLEEEPGGRSAFSLLVRFSMSCPPAAAGVRLEDKPRLDGRFRLEDETRLEDRVRLEDETRLEGGVMLEEETRLEGGVMLEDESRLQGGARLIV